MYATGYGSMNGYVAQVVSQEVADRVGKCWGLGSGTAKDPGPWEGELRNMWKPTQRPGLLARRAGTDFLMPDRRVNRLCVLAVGS